MFYGLKNDQDLRSLAECIEQLRRLFGDVYAADELIVVRRNTKFLSNATLRAATERALAMTEDSYLRCQAESKLWRLHVLTWAASIAMSIGGSFVECGAFDGFSASVIADFTNFFASRETYFIYDTFSGLTEKYATQQELLKNQFYRQHTEVESVCRARFAHYQNVEIIAGPVPDTLFLAGPESVAFAHIDLNCAAAEAAALDFLYGRLATGGIIILDDYGKRVFHAQSEAHDQFAANVGTSILELPTGQGLLIKPSRSI